MDCGGALQLPPGFRFHPTDDELVACRRRLGQRRRGRVHGRRRRRRRELAVRAAVPGAVRARRRRRVRLRRHARVVPAQTVLMQRDATRARPPRACVLL
ncbi:NAC domain-containing protein 2 [Zea mays]|nr:NAC domain-containing protein 2 [Zea mays]